MVQYLPQYYSYLKPQIVYHMVMLILVIFILSFQHEKNWTINAHNLVSLVYLSTLTGNYRGVFSKSKTLLPLAPTYTNCRQGFRRNSNSPSFQTQTHNSNLSITVSFLTHHYIMQIKSPGVRPGYVGLWEDSKFQGQEHCKPILN